MDRLELLSKWALLEPDRCCFPGDKLLLKLGSEKNWLLYPPFDDPIDNARLQYAVQRAIDYHGLLMRFENSQQGKFHGRLLEVETNQSTVGANEELWIALLKAYVGWLEGRGEQGVRAEAIVYEPFVNQGGQQ